MLHSYMTGGHGPATGSKSHLRAAARLSAPASSACSRRAAVSTISFVGNRNRVAPVQPLTTTAGVTSSRGAGGDAA